MAHTARCQDLETRASGEEPCHELRFFEDLLEVVQDQEDLLLSEVLFYAFLERSIRRFDHAKGSGYGRGH
jgi:hypothetical protein